MNTLWPLGEGTVRQIQEGLAASRPRAYTTIMTIMDRLARKGVVARRKVGRAYLYRPNLTAEEARAHAIEQVVEGFFQGSAEGLATLLAGGGQIPARGTVRRERPTVAHPPEPRAVAQPETKAAPEVDQSAEPTPIFPTTRLDESLL